LLFQLTTTITFAGTMQTSAGCVRNTATTIFTAIPGEKAHTTFAATFPLPITTAPTVATGTTTTTTTISALAYTFSSLAHSLPVVSYFCQRHASKLIVIVILILILVRIRMPLPFPFPFGPVHRRSIECKLLPNLHSPNFVQRR
jgi:hypothetical protein